MIEKIKEIFKTGFLAFWLFIADLLIYGLYPQNFFVEWFCFFISIALAVAFCKGYRSIALGVSGVYFVIGLFVCGKDNIVSGLIEIRPLLIMIACTAAPCILAIAVIVYYISKIGRGSRRSVKNGKSSVNKPKELPKNGSVNKPNKKGRDGSCVDGYLFKGCNPYHPTWAIGYVNRDGYVFRKGSMTHNSHAVGYVSGGLIYVTGSSYPVACIKGKNLYNGSMPEHETRAIAHIDDGYIFKGASSEHYTYANANYDGKSSYGLAAYYLLMM